MSEHLARTPARAEPRVEFRARESVRLAGIVQSANPFCHIIRYKQPLLRTGFVTYYVTNMAWDGGAANGRCDGDALVAGESEADFFAVRSPFFR